MGFSYQFLPPHGSYTGRLEGKTWDGSALTLSGTLEAYGGSEASGDDHMALPATIAFTNPDAVTFQVTISIPHSPQPAIWQAEEN